MESKAKALQGRLSERTHPMTVLDPVFLTYSHLQFCNLEMRDLPNMGVKERGQPEVAVSSPGDLSPASSTVSIPGHLEGHSTASSVPQRLVGRHANGNVAAGVGIGTAGAGAAGPIGWPTKISKIIWEKWTWGVFMLVAILVARFSS